MTALTRIVLAVALTLGSIANPWAADAAPSAGADPCPEPNDELQAACYLGPGADAIGFLSRPDDVDAYRIEVLDFKVDAHIELTEMPFPYRLSLIKWNGDVIRRTSMAGGGNPVIEVTLDLPGAYFIMVDSETGRFSDSRPYHLSRQLTYPGATIPQILYTGEFRPGTDDAVTGSTEFADHISAGGKYTIAMKLAGSAADPSRAWAYWGPTLTDFTLTVDARIANSTDAGFQIFFRRQDDKNGYLATVDAKDGKALLSKQVKGELTNSGWKPTDAIDKAGGVNRIVVRCAGEDILVNINGAEVIHVSDSSFRKGGFGFGAVAWGDPPVVNFDNVIVTTPTEG